MGKDALVVFGVISTVGKDALMHSIGGKDVLLVLMGKDELVVLC